MFEQSGKQEPTLLGKYLSYLGHEKSKFFFNILFLNLFVSGQLHSRNGRGVNDFCRYVCRLILPANWETKCFFLLFIHEDPQPFSVSTTFSDKSSRWIAQFAKQTQPFYLRKMIILFTNKEQMSSLVGREKNLC